MNEEKEKIKEEDTCFNEGQKRKLWVGAQKRFEEKKNRTFEKKIVYSENLIQETLKEFGDDIAVSCSFGKDSVLTLALVRKFRPNIMVVFANTGVEYPETYRFRDYLVKKWNLNFFEVNPIKSFWQCVKEYGYPHPRCSSKTAKKKGIKSGKPRCCEFLKERPLRFFYKKKNIKAIFTGINFDEGWQRRYSVIRYGDYYFTKGQKLWKIHPIAYWTTQEVWRYTKENNLPINGVYELVDRSGCIPCTGHLKWQEQMSKVSPSLYKKIKGDMLSKNNQIVLELKK